MKFKDGIFDFRGDLSSQEAYSEDYFSHHAVMTTAPYLLEEWHKSFLARFDENFSNVKNKVIFDGGVGQGYMTIELARRGAFIIACDLVWPALVRLRKIAQEQKVAQNILFICCSLEKLPLKSKSVDISILNAVLEHLEDDRLAIKEINRVSKSSAGLMITAPLAYRYVHPCFRPVVYWEDKKIGHQRRYSKEDLLERFVPFGFKSKKTYYSGHWQKVVLTKIFAEWLKTNRYAKLAERIDRREESVCSGASNLCLFFERK